MVKTYGELYRYVKELLAEEEGIQAPNTARELIALASGYSPAAVMGMQSIFVSEQVRVEVMRLAERMLAGEPLAYILGKWSFFGLDLTVTPDVLIPRDDTMAVTELALEAPLPSAPRVLDLCTGSGCIGLAIASRIKDARVTLADLSRSALRIAKRNASDLHLSGRVSCIEADVRLPAAPFLGQFDLIVSNPPYVTREEMTELPRSVADFEPYMALDGGEDGLDFYRAITENFKRALKPEGFLCLEFGLNQHEAVCRILRQSGFTVLRLKKDTGGIVRAVLAQRTERSDEHGN